MAVGYFPDTALESLELLEHSFYLMQQGMAVFRELDIAAHMAKEVQSCFLLDILHGQTEGGLGHVQGIRCPGYVFVTAYLGVILHLLNVHHGTSLFFSLQQSIDFINR